MVAGSSRQPIPVPGDFPVSWPNPEYQQMFWFWDQMHHPHPVTPMTASIDGRAFTGGVSKAARALHMPVETFLTETYNGYWYHSAIPVAGTPDEMAAREKLLEAEMMQRAPRVLDDWNSVYLPEVKALNARLREYDYRGASLRQLAGFLDEVMVLRERQWELHFLAVFVAMGAAFQFAQVYEGIFGSSGNNEHYGMLQGFPNKSVEAGQVLYDLAAGVKSNAALASKVQETPAGRLLADLRDDEAGRELLGKLEAYLDEYGWRTDNFELINPCWREEPSPAIHSLKSCLGDGATDPRVEQEHAARERERLVDEMLARAPDASTREQLQMLVGVAQQYLPVQENHNFYIDQMNTVLLRLPLLEIGRRLVDDGIVEERDDVFFLSVEEIQRATASPGNNLRSVVSGRRADRERWSKLIPPLHLGTPMPADSPRNEVMDRFFGFGLEPSKDPKVIRGHGASKGVVTATARVLRSLSEADKLEPGDILVCEMTMPSWTPLFSTISAVVADSGGVLSHCAIVAREYGIPCVVGTVVGTQRIKDGQALTVDGASGIVRIDG